MLICSYTSSPLHTFCPCPSSDPVWYLNYFSSFRIFISSKDLLYPPNPPPLLSPTVSLLTGHFSIHKLAGALQAHQTRPHSTAASCSLSSGTQLPPRASLTGPSSSPDTAFLFPWHALPYFCSFLCFYSSYSRFLECFPLIFADPYPAHPYRSTASPWSLSLFLQWEYISPSSTLPEWFVCLSKQSLLSVFFWYVFWWPINYLRAGAKIHLCSTQSSTPEPTAPSMVHAKLIFYKWINPFPNQSMDDFRAYH